MRHDHFLSKDLFIEFCYLTLQEYDLIVTSLNHKMRREMEGKLSRSVGIRKTAVLMFPFAV
jgi:hypothetical protein